MLFDGKSSLNEEILNKIGGVKALESKLNTDYRRGLSGDEKDFNNRIALYGRNEVNFASDFFVVTGITHRILSTFSVS